MTPSNFPRAHKKLSDKRPWSDIRRELDNDNWSGFYEAVKSGDMSRPVVEPIRRGCVR